MNLPDEEGATVVRRQVSTEWGWVRAFLAEVRARAEPHGGFLAMVEVCGFNDWLLKLLAEYGCGELVLVQPAGRSRRKDDRRDASHLIEQLWLNRHRLQRLVQWCTKTMNKVHHLLLKHNLQQESRRGAKIARVAVMRRLATIRWHMARHNEPYVVGGLRATR